MELVLKVYNQSTITAQIQDIFEANIDFDVNNFGTCSIKIPVIEGLKKYYNIELCEVDWVDRTIFKWYIYDLIVWTRDIEIIWRTIKELMNYKLVINEKSFVDKTMSEIVSDILSDWNTAYSENWTFSTNDTTLITKDYKIWDNVYDIIEELSWLVWKVWDVNWTEIIVAELLGEDKTSWINNIALIYNWKDPYGSNIINPVSKSYSSLRNIIIWMDWDWKTRLSDSTSITDFWALGEAKTFRDWDRVDNTQLYLDSKKDEQRMFEIDIDTDWLDINIWDKVNLIIENANSYLNFEWEVFVNTKSIQYINRTLKETVWISDIYVYVDNILNRLRQIEKNVKLLNL